MNHDEWHDRWKRRDIGFHQPHGHDQLPRWWHAVAAPPGSTVFVPLCGKSRDMAWLAEQGHHIIGAELSDIAVAEFFDERGLRPVVSDAPGFKVYKAGPYTLYCGDVFALSSDILKNVAAVYDRAALIAFQPELQSKYAAKLAELLPPRAAIFIISIDYPEGEVIGPPFAVPRSEVEKLFGENFAIDVLETRDGLLTSANLKNRGVTRLEETAYLLRRRA